MKYKALVLEGGGAKGIVYAAMAEVLEHYDILQHINIFAGSSIGALFSLLFALRIPASALRDFVDKTDFSDLLDNPGPSAFQIMSMLWRWGFSNGQKVSEMLDKICKLSPYYDKLSTFSFKELKAITGNTLMATSVNLNTRRLVVFSPDETPDVSVKLAVRASMAIPLVFDPVDYDGDYLVDGGVGDNFPIEEVLAKTTLKREDILGAKFITPDEKEGSTDTIYDKRTEINTRYDALIALVDSLFIVQENRDLLTTPDFWKHTIPLHIENLSIMKMSFTKEEKDRFRQRAIDDVENFIKNWNS